MLKKTILIAGLGIATLGAQPVFARDDTVIGALIGAGVGAAIGHNVGGEHGAVLGGAIGAVTGASIGGADRGYTRTHYEAPQAYYTPQPAYVEAPAYPRQAPVFVERIDYPAVSYRDRDARHWKRHHHRRHDRCDEDRHGHRHSDAYHWR